MSRASVFNLLSKIKENKIKQLVQMVYRGNLLKICANEIADVLTLLFQVSLDQGCLPSDCQCQQAQIESLFSRKATEEA